ncbi:HTH-type transcriptional repressor PurR [Agathobaculum sp. TL06]
MEKKNKINMRLIAQSLGISAATVSRALHNPEKVKPETLKKVLNAVDELNYVPKQLPPSSANLIAYVISNINNQFYNEILRKLTDFAVAENYFVLACNTNGDPIIENNMFDYFQKIGCAGIVLTGLTRLKNIYTDIPTVLLSSPDTTEGNFYSVHADSDAAMKILIDYLMKLNHRKIGFISGDAQSLASKERSSAFIRYMRSLDLNLPESYIYSGGFDINSGLAAFDYFYSIPDMPTAIISANDDMAKGFIIRANSLGIKIPNDISICGIDAMDGDIFSPRITSVHQSINEIARKTFSIIRDGNEGTHQKHSVFPVVFSPGNTCYRR